MRNKTSAAFALLVSGLLIAAPLSATAAFADEVDPSTTSSDATVVETPETAAPAPEAEAPLEESPAAEAPVTEAPAEEAPAEEAPTDAAPAADGDGATDTETETSDAPAPRGFARSLAVAAVEYQGVPGVATNIVVTGTPVGDGTWNVLISWTAPSQITADTTYRVDTTDDVFRLSNQVGSATQLAMIIRPRTGNYANDHLHVTIYSSNSYGTSSGAQVRGARTNGYVFYNEIQPLVVTAPGVPTGLAVTRATDRNSQTLSWTAPASNGNSAITGYTITKDDGTGPVATTVGAGVTSYAWDSLTAGTSYTYTVSAFNVQGNGSAASTTSVFAALAPYAATGVGGEAYSPRQASITWDAPTYDGGAEITNYKVVVNTNPGTQTIITEDFFPAITIDVASHVNSSLSAVVYASNDNGLTYGSASTSGTIAFGTFVPDAPVVSATAQNYHDVSVLVEWEAPASNGSTITGYDVWIYRDGQQYIRQDADADATSLVVSGLEPETELEAMVVTKSAIGDSEISNFAPFTSLASAPDAVPSELVTETGDISVRVDGDYLLATLESVDEGTWVYGTAYSTPIGLGWARVGTGGFVFWNMAGAQLPYGQHHLVVQSEFGAVLGSTAFALTAPVVAAPVVAPAAVAAAAVTPAALASTGAESGSMIAAALALLAVGAALTLRRRIATAVTSRR